MNCPSVCASATSATLPTELGGVQVSILDAAGTRRNAGLFFVSPTQVNFQIPAATSAGVAVISVLRNGTAVGQGVATIASVAPALFSANANGQGVAAAVVLRAGHSLTEDELKTFIGGYVTKFKVPAKIVFMEALPKGPSGKILKRAIRDGIVSS